MRIATPISHAHALQWGVRIIRGRPAGGAYENVEAVRAVRLLKSPARPPTFTVPHPQAREAHMTPERTLHRDPQLASRVSDHGRNSGDHIVRMHVASGYSSLSPDPYDRSEGLGTGHRSVYSERA